MFNSNVIVSSVYINDYDASKKKMNCISRIDEKEKNLFVEKRYSRWNLYSQIAIENDTLVCAKERYYLTDICHDRDTSKPLPCTLLDTNEVVEIGLGKGYLQK